MHLIDAQREMLCEMTSYAFLEIRQFAAAGKLEQAFDLAAAFHYLLDDMWDDQFSMADFRQEILVKYQLKYPNPGTRNYVELVDQIVELGNQPVAASQPRLETNARQPDPAGTMDPAKTKPASSGLPSPRHFS
jgi:hypothetical protein